MSELDKDEIRRAAEGRMVDVLHHCAGIDPDILDGKHHPCPKCGGENRFRLIDETAGAVFCNVCFKIKNGDFFAAIAWMKNLDPVRQFSDVKKIAADYLNIGEKNSNGKSQPEKASKVVAKYEYKDEYGKTLFEVLRNEPGKNGQKKDFTQRQPNGKGWDYHVKGVRIIPYHLDEIVNRPDKTVMVAEGEKAVDALRGIGLTATCNSGGAGKWKAEHAEHLKNRRVIILPDNDEPGRKHAYHVARSLWTFGSDIRIVTLPNLPEKGDAVEWIAAGGTKEKLCELVNATPVWTPDGEAPEAEEETSNFVRLYSPRELREAFPSMAKPVIHGLLREREVCNAIAAAKAGKSWMAIDLALSVVTGRPWLGEFQTVPGKVLIMDNELDGGVIQDRLTRIADARVLSIDEYESIRVCVGRGEGITLDSLESRVLSQYEPGELRLIIIDAWYRALPEGTDENDNAGIAKAYNLIDALAKKWGCAFVLVHHASKGNQSAKAITDVGSGAGSQSRAADTHLILRPHREPEVAVLEAVVRSWAPIEPKCLRWTFPTWNPDENLNPTDLRPEKNGRQNQNATSGDPAEKNAEKILDVLKNSDEPLTAKEIREAAKMNNDVFGTAFELVQTELEVIEKRKKNNRVYPHFRLPKVASGQASGQTGQNLCPAACPSDQGIGTRTTPLGVSCPSPDVLRGTRRENGENNSSLVPVAPSPGSPPQCRHHDPSTFERRADGYYCPGCDRWKSAL